MTPLFSEQPLMPWLAMPPCISLFAKRAPKAFAAKAFGPTSTSTSFGVTVVNQAAHHVAVHRPASPGSRTFSS